MPDTAGHPHRPAAEQFAGYRAFRHGPCHDATTAGPAPTV
jgi:hypothetical protein